MRPEVIHYGPRRGQVGELWRPAEATPRPVVVLIHGGYWRDLYTKYLMRALARAVVAEGWMAWNIEYRRIGLLGGGGGWPATFSDVDTAIDHVVTVTDADPTRVVTLGHSAGGQLALWAAARPGLPVGAPGAHPALAVRASVALAGVVDLEEGDRLGLGNGAVAAFLGGDPTRQPERYRLASPAARLPIGVPHALVHGTADTTVPSSMSADYAMRASALGDDVEFIAVPGAGHRDLISPRSGAWSPTLSYLRSVLR
jgi:acetyl esterase/lipase